MATAPKRGAPKKAAKDKKDAHITVWLSAEQKAAAEEVAAADGLAAGAWARMLVLRAIDEKKGGKGR